jgi:hypothetical protein
MIGLVIFSLTCQQRRSCSLGSLRLLIDDALKSSSSESPRIGRARSLGSGSWLSRIGLPSVSIGFHDSTNEVRCCLATLDANMRRIAFE